MIKPPVGQVEGKKHHIETMFDAVAHRYDFLNRAFSLGIDKLWRRNAINILQKTGAKHILDVATGTADLAIAAMRVQPEHITGVDISEGMLALGRKKIAERGLTQTISLQQADSENLPFADASFEAVMVSFGVRNFENLQAGLKEMRRVLKPNGIVIILEFSKPQTFPIKQLFNFYFHRILPPIGSKVSGVDGAYQYLNESAMEFPDGEKFLEQMKQAGFSQLKRTPQTFGIATIYTGNA
jgi:demethylmenaquinone methyltransferase/2-methoxy-6-polyprenyl-1,4-benzoquinol methylase